MAIAIYDKKNFDAKPGICAVNILDSRNKRGKIDFDNPIQRGYVWNNKMRSLYIHSLLFGILEGQSPFLVSKHGDVWSIIDGKQRGTALLMFINNEFALTGLKDELPILVDGTVYDNINGKRFKQLPEELREEISNFTINMLVLENATPEIESLFFNRLNGGKAMSKIDLARSKNKSINVVQEISKHEIFSAMFSDAQLKKKPCDEIVIKTWQTLVEETTNYSSAHFYNNMKNVDITPEDRLRIENVYDTILETYKLVLLSNPDIAKIMLKKTHLFAYMPCVSNFDTKQELADWIIKFYSEMPEQYMEASKSHTTDKSNIALRSKLVQESVEDFLVKSEQGGQGEQMTLQEA